MATFTIATDIFNQIDTGLDTLFGAGLSNFAGLIAPLIGALVSMYFVFVALNYLWKEDTRIPVGEILRQMAYLALFTAFAFNIPYYNTIVVEPVGSIGHEISEAFAMTGANAPQVIDQMISQMYNTSEFIWQGVPPISWTNIPLKDIFFACTTIAIVWFGGGVYTLISFTYLMIAKILVSLVLLLGPLYISAAFFPSFRSYFFQWLGQVFNYVLLAATLGITFTLLTNLIQFLVSGEGFDNMITGSLTLTKFLLIYLVFSGVTVALPSLTSSLTGGVGISSFGQIAPIMGSIAGGVGGGATKGLMMLGKKGLDAMRKPNSIGPSKLG